MKRTKVTINTNHFEWSHGRKPKGYGLWWFATDLGPDFSFTGSYGQAKRYAVTVAKQQGAAVVFVLS